MDRPLGKLNRRPPRWLEVNTQFYRKPIILVADGIDSDATFWQYADSGTFPGDQDLFNGNAAGLSRYGSQCTCLPVFAKINRQSSLGWLWAPKMIGLFKAESERGVDIPLVQCSIGLFSRSRTKFDLFLFIKSLLVDCPIYAHSRQQLRGSCDIFLCHPIPFVS